MARKVFTDESLATFVDETKKYTDESVSVKADKTQAVFYIEGGGTTDTTNKVATWTGSHSDISEYYPGLMIAYKVGTAGSSTTTLNINNLGAVSVVKNATTAVSTSFPVKSIILLVYTVDSSTAYWKAHDYDANTRNTVGDYRKNGTKLYFVGTASSDASTSSSYATSYTNSNIYVDTDNVLYSTSGFSGDLSGNATSATTATSATSATKATQDASGNTITSTYETKSAASAKLTEAKTYADNAAATVKNDLLNGAGTAYDTLKELGDLIVDNADAIDALETIASGKADATHAHAISDITNLQSTLDGKAAASHGTHVSFDSTNKPQMDGTAAFGTSTKVARADHVHPTDTSRASQSSLDSHTGDTTVHITATERTNWNAAKTHADSAHAPSNAQANQNAFSNIAVSGQTTVAADTTTDTVTFAGSNVTITTDATNDKVTFTVANGSTSAKGVVQLTNSTSSTSTTTAATPSSVKSAYDLANTAKTNAATAQTKADSAYTLAEGKVDSLSDLGITATATELNYVDGVTSNIQTQLDGKSASGHTHNYAGSSSAGGAATSANKLATTRYIDGVSFTGEGNVTRYATCSTAAGTVAKTASITSGTFSLATGARVTVKFSNANSAASPTLNVGSTGAKAIYWHGAALASGQYWEAGAVLDFVYNGTQWELVGVAKDNNTTYSAAGSSLGLVKTGGDVTISSGTITVNDDSHNHVISNIDNLQSTLDGKAPTSHASTATTYGTGTSSNYGHVKLSDSTSSTSSTSGGIAATPAAVKVAYDLANSKANASHTHSGSDITSGTIDAARLPDASETADGIVNTTSQTFAGNKTFEGSVSVGNLTAGGDTSMIGHSLTPFDSAYFNNLYVGTTFSGGSTRNGGVLRVSPKGTTTTKGVATLQLGNNTASGNEGNAYGVVELYNQNTGSVKLSASHNDNTNISVYLPSSPGTLALSGHKHAAGDITSGTLAIERGGTGATTAAGALTNLGLTATATELNYVDGVTSNIQAQLDGKLSTSGGEVTGPLVLSCTTDASGLSDTKPALIIGGKSSQPHIAIDGNEIIAKANATTPTTLYLGDDTPLSIVSITGYFRTNNNNFGTTLPATNIFAGRIFFKKVT